MKTIFVFRHDKQFCDFLLRRKVLQLRFQLIAVVFVLLSHCITQTQAQQCGTGSVNCFVQYKTTYSSLVKCAFDEYTNQSPPRVQVYHTQVTAETFDYLYLDEELQTITTSYTGGSIGPGLRIDKTTTSESATQTEHKTGYDCDYTNFYVGNYTGLHTNHDTRFFQYVTAWGQPGSNWESNTIFSELVTKEPQFIVDGDSSAWKWIVSVSGSSSREMGGDCSGSVCYDTSFTNIWSYIYTNTIGIPDITTTNYTVSPTVKVFVSDDPDGTGGYTMTLSSEYTDDELRANIIATMPSYPTEWYTPGNDFSQMVAYSVINGNHKNATCWTDSGYAELQKMKYRLAVPATEIGRCRISWYVYTYDLTTRSLDYDFHYLDVATDPNSAVYTPEYEVAAPYWDPSNEDCGGLVLSWVDNVKISPILTANIGAPGSGPFFQFGGGAGGCSSCGNSDGLPGFDVLSGGIAAHISLGQSYSNWPAGSFDILAVKPSLRLGTPANLHYTTNDPNIAIIVVSNQIRQLYAPQAMVDVVASNTFGYELRYYLPSQVGSLTNGIYQLSGSPYVIWKIENPDASTNTYNRLRLTETRGADIKVYDYTYGTNTSSWKLIYPGSLREDEMAVTITTNNQIFYYSFVYQPIPSMTRTVTITTRVPGGSDVIKTKRVYKTFEWGEGLVQEIFSPDFNPKTNSFVYNDSFNADGQLLKPLRLAVRSDGSWIYYRYDTFGRIDWQSVGLEDHPAPSTESESDIKTNNRSTEYDYTTTYTSASGDDGMQHTNVARKTIEYFQSTPVAVRYVVFLPGERHDIRCPTPGATWDAAGNLVTITKFYTNGVNLNRIKSVENPDGTMVLYEYLWASDGSQTNTVYSGVPGTAKTNIIDGIKDVTILGPLAQKVSNKVSDIISGITLSSEIYTNYDSFDRPQRVTYLDGTYVDTYYACCGVDNTVDRDGVTTQYYYDAAKRQVASMRLGIITTNVLDAASRTLRSIRVGSDNSAVTLSQSAYNLAGELVAETNALNGVTTFNETTDTTTGGLIRSTTYPDGGTSTNFYYVDGSLKQTLGTATHGARYTNGAEYFDGGYYSYTQEIKLDTGANDTSEWTKSYTDMLGRSYKTIYSDDAVSVSYYNRFGQLTNQLDPDGVSTIYQYNSRGEVAYTAIDMNQDGVIDFGGADRITYTTNDVTTSHSTNVRRSRTYVWDTLSVNSSTPVSLAESSTDGLKSWQTQYRDVGTPVTSQTQTAYGSNNRTVTATAPDSSYTISIYTDGRLGTTTRYDSTGAQLGQTSYSYDAHGRQYQTTDARNGATTYAYNNADLISSVTTPNPGSGGPAQTTTTFYNKMLQTTNILQPDGTSVTNEYFLTGELKKTYGSRTYPVEYTYDYAGRMKTMKTWQNFAANSSTAVTTWNYDAQRGWLTNKAYADNQGPFYTYTPAGRLSSRIWVRGVVTTNEYDTAGGLYSVNYTDSTPGVTNTYDRIGRVSTVFCNGMTDTLSYNLANELLGESFSGGILNGLAITNAYDAYLRRTAVALNTQPSTLTQFGYDNASRLSSVTNGSNTAGYTYLANSSLVSQIAFKQSGTTRMTTTKQYDYLNRLTSISSVPSASSAVNFNYNYNSANQRVQSTLVDGSYWSYGYDSLGQVTSGKRFWADGTPVAGQQFDYAFDTIGNRNSTKTGGDETGANQRSASYTNNTLNQITGRDVPGYVDIKGISIATNTVTVAGLTAYRKGEYFRKELSVANGSAAFWTNIVAAATGQTSTTGNVFVAKTPETFLYDLDGNLTNDGRWTFNWDAENRLTNMTSLGSAPAGSKLKLDFAFDAQGRRIQKVVSTNNGSAYVGQSTNKFVYDGWNLIAILNPQSSIFQSVVWGSDISGTPQGAGGVGGLLATVNYGVLTNFVAYDGNGNVAALVNAWDGTVAANYEYGPFGEVIRATGSTAKANPFRFSTKYQDDESDLLYYGYRFYNQSQGRWLSRDPVEEEGGENIYSLTVNASVDFIDFIGLWTIDRKISDPRALAIAAEGDTVEGLANLIHLDKTEYRKWLQPLPPSQLPNSASEPISGCQWFKIPNKVYINDLLSLWGPDILLVTAFRQWERVEVRDFIGEGFDVVRVNDTLKAQFLTQLSDADAHGIVVLAHGDPNYKGDFSDAGLDYVMPDEAAAVLHHKLGGFKAIWCWSGVKKSGWRGLVSPTGYLWSYPEYVRIWHSWPGVIQHGL